MKRNKKKIIIVTVILTIGVISGVSYQHLINYLSSQAANPTGFIGRAMTRIWSVSFHEQNQWGYSLVNINDEDVILSVGFGSGSGIKHIKERNNKNTIYGIDISEEAVKTAASLNQEYINIGEVILSVGNVANLEFEDSFFNLVIAG